MKHNPVMGFLVAVLIVLGGSGAWSYEIGVGDVLEIDMWQQPELTTTARVYGDGTVVLPVVGAVRVEGMTLAQAASSISQKLSAFNPRISQVTVTVMEFNANSVLVLGEVTAPGRYGFEAIPDLVSVLSEAGGPRSEAALSNVYILRANSGDSKGLIVDLEKALNERNLGSLPNLRPGDAIWVPSRTGFIGESRVSVFGEVRNPGVYAVGSDADMLEVILLAGGPTAEGNLGRVKLMRSTKGSTVVNLNSYLDGGERHSIPVMSPDDVLVVERKSRFWSTVWNGFREMVVVAGAMAGIYFVYESVGD